MRVDVLEARSIRVEHKVVGVSSAERELVPLAGVLVGWIDLTYDKAFRGKERERERERKRLSGLAENRS